MSQAFKSYFIKPGVVEYVDLCEHSGISKEEFFSELGVKTLRVYGLIHETDDFVKILFYDDMDDNTECQGIVIPASCVINVIYFVPEQDAKLQKHDPNVN